MQTRVIVVGAARGPEQLTYEVPPEFHGRVAPGQRVLVPIRSRRVTGVVLEVGDALGSDGAPLKPLLEVLEPQPLFDRPHLELMEFLAGYYMVPLADAYRGVIPALARVESRRVFQPGAPPPALAAAAFTATERAIVAALAKQPKTARELRTAGDRRAVEAALARLIEEGWVETREATRGRHRDSRALTARLMTGARTDARGSRQREILRLIAASADNKVEVAEIERNIAGARPALRTLAARGVIEMREDADARTPPPAEAPSGELELNQEQRRAFEAIAPSVSTPRFETFLLWGVTASGKTEVYLHLAALALRAGRQVLVLVPEVALAEELVRSFRARFGALVGVAHSAQTVAERWKSWTAALGGRARIMIGPRSAAFAPLRQAGLIVVDEEHDPSYKQEEGIRYHARDLAVMLGRLSGCPVVLGSATPSAESFFNARRGRYRMLRMTRRVNERPMAAVEVIDLRGERDERRASGAEDRAASVPAREPASPVPLSAAMLTALRANLAAGGQGIVFLNRRGYQNFLQCHLCGNVIACSNCSVSLTFHLRDRSLRCHYCGERAPAPDLCPACGGMGLSGQGFGTERLTAALEAALPGARIERMDSDTSGRRGARARMVEALRRGEIDLLVGTQMVTKGFDFPDVTLVGVVLADLALNLPDFRSAERTFQLLTQVAGRAGRGERPGRVLIQTYAPSHYSIRAARDQDYERFMRRELQLRRELMYPPFARLAMVRVEGADGARVREIAARAAANLIEAARGTSMRVLGPAPAPLERIRGRWRCQVMIKSPALKEMRAALLQMRAAVGPAAERDRVHLGIDIDPVNMM